GELRLEVAQFRTRGQAPVPQQEADFLEGGVGRQIVDVVAAVRQHAAVAIDPADRGGRRDDVFEPALWFVGCRSHACILKFNVQNSKCKIQGRCMWNWHRRPESGTVTSEWLDFF